MTKEELDIIKETYHTAGYEYAIEKAAEWLEDNAINYVGKDGITDWRQVYKDFREAMKPKG